MSISVRSRKKMIITHNKTAKEKLASIYNTFFKKTIFDENKQHSRQDPKHFPQIALDRIDHRRPLVSTRRHCYSRSKKYTYITK